MKVTLTYSEAVEMLKKAYYPHYLSVNKNVELEIEPNVTDAIAVTEDNPWFDVPKDWNYDQCPHGKDFGKIEILTWSGHNCSGPASDWTVMWRQDNHPSDIIQYRKVI